MDKKNFKTGTCRKCKIEFYIDDHHILPQSKFGKNGKTATLCPNCHRHVHVYLELKAENKNDEKQVKKLWEYWLKYVKIGIITCILVAIGFSIYS